ncbi:MAG: DUF5011 domain-containing protein [Bacteroidetes bacterium]|nr:DUF5011 domain-containing protein [Bacteroidota bacterium]
MKKNILIVGASFLITGLILINGCKKDDTTPPVVSLNGATSVTLSLNSAAYSDPGATAKDDQDGAITPTSDFNSSTNPNTNHTGTYTITYTATDKAGNTGTAVRTVIVKNDAAYLEGSYLTSEDAFVTSWTQTITADATHNNRILFSKFGNYSNNTGIYAQVTGSSVELPTAQNGIGIGLSGCTHTFTPNGTGTVPVALVSGKYNFSIKFTDQEQVGGSGCSGTSAVPYEDAFHQQ